MSCSLAAVWQVSAAASSTPRSAPGSSAIVGVFALLDLRQAQQIFDDRVQAVGLLGHDPQEPLGVDRVVHGAVEQRFDKALDRRDRRLQLVRDVGHEVAADVFQLAKVGDVVEHDHRADGAALESRAAPSRGPASLARDRHAAPRRPRSGSWQASARVTNRLRSALRTTSCSRRPCACGLIQPQQAARGRVHADHALLAVDGQHAFGHAGQHGFLFVVVLDQDADAALQLLGHAIEAVGQLGQFARVGHGARAAQSPAASRSAAWPIRRAAGRSARGTPGQQRGQHRHHSAGDEHFACIRATAASSCVSGMDRYRMPNSRSWRISGAARYITRSSSAGLKRISSCMPPTLVAWISGRVALVFQFLRPVALSKSTWPAARAAQCARRWLAAGGGKAARTAPVFGHFGPELQSRKSASAPGRCVRR